MRTEYIKGWVSTKWFNGKRLIAVKDKGLFRKLLVVENNHDWKYADEVEIILKYNVK